MKLATKFNLALKKRLHLAPSKDDIQAFLDAAKENDGSTLDGYLDAFGEKIINRRSKYATTALIWATFYDHVDAVNRLLTANADANAYDSFRNTSAHYAVSEGSLGCLQRLIAHHADLERTNGNGETPLILALKTPNREEYIKTLLNGGARIEHPNRMGETPLLAAYRLNNMPYTMILVRAGANLLATDNNDRGLPWGTQASLQQAREQFEAATKAAELAVFSTGTEQELCLKSGKLALRRPNVRKPT